MICNLSKIDNYILLILKSLYYLMDLTIDWKYMDDRLNYYITKYPHLEPRFTKMKQTREENRLRNTEGDQLNRIYLKGQISFIDKILESKYELTEIDFKLIDIDMESYIFNFVIRNLTTNYLVILKTGSCITIRDNEKWEDANYLSSFIENPIIVIVPEEIDTKPLNDKFTLLNFCHTIPEPFMDDKNVFIAQSFMGQCCSYEASDEEFDEFIKRLDEYDNVYALEKNYNEFDKRISLSFVPEIEVRRWNILKQKITPRKPNNFITNCLKKQLGEAFHMRADVFTEKNHFSKDQIFNKMVNIKQTSENVYTLYRRVKKE